MPISTSSVHQEAAEWVQNEENSWSPPRSGMAPPLPSQGLGQYQSVGPPPPVIQPRNLNMQAGGMVPREPAAMGSSAGPSGQWAYPTFLDTIPRDAASVPAAAPPSPPPLVMMGRETKRQAKEEKIKVAGESVDEFLQGRAKPGAPGGRGPAKPTRAQRIAERMQRSGTLGSVAGSQGGGREEVQLQQSQLLRKIAAEKIQRAFRAHAKYMKGNRDRIRRENAAATKIQARWRAYHVRRQRLDKAAVCIQRWTRGFLARLVIRRHNAAVIIQRHATGMLARRNLREFARAATKIQRIHRGKAARQHVKRHERSVMDATLLIQRGMRRWKAKKIARGKRMERDAGKARVEAAKKIQSVKRGTEGRKKAANRKAAVFAETAQHRAATRLQATVRRVQARHRVEGMRTVHLQVMNNAATIIRKHWLRCIHRKRYLELQREFLLHESSIVTMQRYVRGFLVRLRMWRDAIRAEEELWAAVEIQRVWRGYMGRLRWELTYEAVWSRHVAALRLQRYCRGWLARTRVHRMRRKKARAEFEKARRRFKAAQKIQANVRAWIVRRQTVAWRNRIIKHVIMVQRCLRGHQLRSRLWQQVLERRAMMLQAAARGFLIRNRRFHFIANVICIQRHYRMWLARVPEAERRRRVGAWRAKRAAAKGVGIAG